MVDLRVVQRGKSEFWNEVPSQQALQLAAVDVPRFGEPVFRDGPILVKNAGKVECFEIAIRDLRKTRKVGDGK
jgi:hypothetical protein